MQVAMNSRTNDTTAEDFAFTRRAWNRPMKFELRLRYDTVSSEKLLTV